MNKSISKALREFRKENNWTQECFADKIGVNRVTYINYENGVRTPDCYVLKKINEVTGLSVDYILGISETKNVAQSDIAKTTGLSEDAIEFLRLTKNNNNFLNSLINLIIKEEKVPIDCYWDELFDQNYKYSEDNHIEHNSLHVLDEIKKHWEINDVECPVEEGESPNITPFEYTMIEEISLIEHTSSTRKDCLTSKDDMMKVVDLCTSKGLFLDKSNLLDSISQYIRFENGGIGLKGASSIELLNRNHCISLYIGGKSVKFPSEESDKIVEQLLLQNIIDSLNKLKDKFTKIKTEEVSS